MRDLTTMAQYLIWAMEGRGMLHTQTIYRAAKQECLQFGRELPNNWQAEIRQTLQAHCASRPMWNGKDDFFVYHKPAHWSCKVSSPTLEELA